MISRTKEHEIDDAGKRLLRETLEPLNCVLNEVQKDYGIDYNVQVLQGGNPTGAWFHIQLKSSASSKYSVQRTFVAQNLPVDHARHYALQMRQPVFLVHADIASRHLYWHAPQLDEHLKDVLRESHTQFVTVRIPTSQELPATMPTLLQNLEEIFLVLGNRELTSASLSSFTDSLRHFPDQEATYRAFQEKRDSLKLQKTIDLFHAKKFPEAKTHAEALLLDPDSAVEIKFWAEMTLQSIDFGEILHAGKPQIELSKSVLYHAKRLQKLTRRGPNYLKFYSLISRVAAELEVLTHEDLTLYMGLQAQLHRNSNPLLAVGLYAQRAAFGKRLLAKYNQCVRLARYARNYADRWMLGRALANIPKALGSYMVTLQAEDRGALQGALTRSLLQILKLAVWICHETGDGEGVILAVSSALATTHSVESELYRWASEVTSKIVDPQIRQDATETLDRAAKRWRGEHVDGDYKGDTIWQIFQNIASGLKIDLSDESSPLVKALRIAARDDTAEPILARCQHLLVTMGNIGPTAEKIRILFGTSQACSKVIHCTLHNFHLEGREQTSAYAEFRSKYCDGCPEEKPRPAGWKLTDQEFSSIQRENQEFVRRLIGTSFAPRHSDKD